MDSSALIINFEGREATGLSKGRYDETLAGEDADLMVLLKEFLKKLIMKTISRQQKSMQHYSVGKELRVGETVTKSHHNCTMGAHFAFNSLEST